MCEFQARFMEAFVVVAGFRPYHREITPSGFTFLSDDDTRIRINFPENCFPVPCIVQFRVNNTLILFHNFDVHDIGSNLDCTELR